MEHVHSGKACADHDNIEPVGAWDFAGTGLQGGHLFALPDLEEFSICRIPFNPTH
jgi:hypothetical protein